MFVWPCKSPIPMVVKESVDFFAEEYPGGYSAAQLARHVAIQVFKSGTPLGDCLSWSIQPPRESTGPPSGLLPLPQWFSAVKVLQRFEKLEVSREGPGDWRERGDTRSKASKVLRYEGICLWHGLAVAAINVMHGIQTGRKLDRRPVRPKRKRWFKSGSRLRSLSMRKAPRACPEYVSQTG